MGTFSQSDRLLSFTCEAAGEDVLLPERLKGVEGISEAFHFVLDVVAKKDTTILFKSIVGQKGCVGIQATDSGDTRYINGYILGMEFFGGDEEFDCYRIYLVPNLWVLKLNVNTRVFQNKTAVEIVKEVLSAYSITLNDETKSSSFGKTQLDYCTQYRETDFNFVSRLLEQFGIMYYFQHSKDDHKFTITDDYTVLDDCPIQNTFRYSPQGGDAEKRYDFIINAFMLQSMLTTSVFTQWEHMFVGHRAEINKKEQGTALGVNKNEYYDYVGSAAGYCKKTEDVSSIQSMLSNLNAAFAASSVSSGGRHTAGTSNAIPLVPGYTLSVADHPLDPLNAKYIITHVEHEVEQNPPYRATGQAISTPYSNTFKTVPFQDGYYPRETISKPVIHGMHTGKVVVPSGEDSYMDKYGRVCVQFWWDRLRKPNTPDNTMLRVAQSWAGKGWGTYFWPRVDDEVLIGFIEGDPDQPIVVGSVYNGVNMPKYDPAGQYTLAGILTRSSKGGAAANANELRFEDLEGKEQVYMNAEKFYDLHVEDTWHTLVGGEQHTTITKKQFEEVGDEAHIHFKNKHLELIDSDANQHIKGNQLVKVEGDRSHNLGGNLKEKIGQDSNISVGQNLNEKVGTNYSLNVGVNEDHKIGMNYNIDAGMQLNIKGGMTINIDAPLGVNLTCGGNFVNLTPAGVMIQGILVNINSGGAATPANSASPQSPEAPDAPTDPTAPTWPGDAPPSQPKTSQDSSSSSPAAAPPAAPPPPPAGPKPPPSPASAASGAAGAAAGAVSQAGQAANQATQEAAQAAQQAANDAQQAANQAEQAVKQAEQQAQQGVNQVMQQARQAYQQANQAVQQAEQQVQQAAAQGQAAAQQALSQAQQQAQQCAQQAAQAVQQAQQQAQQVQQQAQQAAAQAQQAAQQAEQQAQKAAQQAQQQAQQAVQQGQQAAQQAAQQAQQAAQQAQQQAQQAAAQAQQAAKQAQQQAQQAQQQVTQAASQAQQQAQQASQAAQQSAQQAINSLPKGL